MSHPGLDEGPSFCDCRVIRSGSNTQEDGMSGSRTLSQLLQYHCTRYLTMRCMKCIDVHTRTHMNYTFQILNPERLENL